MNCAICKRPGIWSQRYGAILCNAHKRKAEQGVVKLANDNIVILSTVRNEKADAIKWLQQRKQRKSPGRTRAR